MKKVIYFALAPILGLGLIAGAVPLASSGSGYVSVSPAAFTPNEGGASGYYVTGSSLQVNASAEGTYYAPVSLPHGATVRVRPYTLRSHLFKTKWRCIYDRLRCS